MKHTALAIAALAVILAAGCSTTSTAKDFSGLSTPDGMAAHVNTTNVAIHLFGTKPLVGNATLEKTVATCTTEAKALGATKVRIVQSHRTAYWWIPLPVPFVLQPVVTTVAANAIK